MKTKEAIKILQPRPQKKIFDPPIPEPIKFLAASTSTICTLFGWIMIGIMILTGEMRLFEVVFLTTIFSTILFFIIFFKIPL